MQSLLHTFGLFLGQVNLLVLDEIHVSMRKNDKMKKKENLEKESVGPHKASGHPNLIIFYWKLDIFTM